MRRGHSHATVAPVGEAPNTVDRVAITALAAFGALLPLEGIGHWTPRAFLGMQACDLAVVVASPALLVSMWRRRRTLVGSPLVLACLVLAGAGIVAAIVRDGSGASLTEMAKYGVFVLILGGLAAAGAVGRLDALLRAVTVGGVAALAVSLVGFAWLAAVADPLREDLPFVIASAHPALLGLPRLTGTFGISPQEMGEYSVVLLAASWTLRLRSGSRGPLASGALAASALVLTFSSAWLGGLVVAAGRIAQTRRRVLMVTAAAGVATSVAAVFCLMNFGPPLGSDEWARARTFPCESRETEHFVTWSSDEGRTCHQLQMTWPYRSVLTTYWHAKKAALTAIGATPLLGLGRTAYREYAARTFAEGTSGGTELGVYYDRPHCTALEAQATLGLLGGLGFLALVAAVCLSRPASSQMAAPLWFAALGLLLVSLNADLLERRPFWALLGLLAAATQPGTPVRRP